MSTIESSSVRAIGGMGMGGFVPPEIAGSIAEFTQSQKAAVAVVREVHQRMRRIQWKQASVTSLHPWSLTARHASTALEIRMPGVLVDQNELTPLIELPDGRKLAYVQHVYPTYQVATRPTESGDYTASEILPLELACDFIQQHQGAARPDEGGLFAYEGTKTPPQELERYNKLVADHGFEAADEDIIDEYLLLFQSKSYEEQLGRKSEIVLPELSKLQRSLFEILEPLRVACVPQRTTRNIADLQRITVGKALRLAHNRQIVYYTYRFEECQKMYADPDKRSSKGITRNDLKMAKVLKAWGVIQTLPPWITATNPAGAKAPETCPICQAEAKPGALKCMNGNCTHIFHPYEAFKRHLMDLDTAGAITALRRLNKDQLIELKLYPAVKPFDEYLKDLRKEAKEPPTA